MKLYRYMSFEEFGKMSAGCDLYGRGERPCVSFFGESTKLTGEIGICTRMYSEQDQILYDHWDYDTWEFFLTPEMAVQLLPDDGEYDILVEFEKTENEEILYNIGPVRISHPEFAQKFNIYNCSVIEYFGGVYNRERCVPKRYALVCDEGSEFEWHGFR